MRAFAQTLAGIFAFALTSCAPLLEADTALLSPAQGATAPVAAGIWIHVTSACPETWAEARYLPAQCRAFDLRRLRDGTWRLDRIDPSPAHESITSLLIHFAAATEHLNAYGAASLYVAEFASAPGASPARLNYAAIIPAGAPATQQIYVIPILCRDVLDAPPIEGLTAARDANGDIIACAVADPAALRQAAQRAALAHLGDMQLIQFIRWTRSHRASPELLVQCPPTPPALPPSLC